MTTWSLMTVMEAAPTPAVDTSPLAQFLALFASRLLLIMGIDRGPSFNAAISFISVSKFVAGTVVDCIISSFFESEQFELGI